MEQDRLIKVIEVEAEFDLQPTIYRGEPAFVKVPKIALKLEDGRTFNLWHVPPEIVRAIKRVKGEEGEDDELMEHERESLFDILPYFQNAVKEIGKAVERVIIDGEIRLDDVGVVYKATLELNLDMMKVKITMIPSHAVYLALVTEKPIYVSEKLVKEQERDENEL